MKKKVIVVGAGVGGLSTAIRLLCKGYDVEIIEKEPIAGGKMHQIEGKGFKFDVGPTIIMMPHLYKEVFELAGKNPDDYIPMKQLDPIYTLNFPDGDRHVMSTDLYKLTTLLESVSEEDTLGYYEYLADTYKRYLVAKDQFIEKSFRKKRDFYNPNSMVGAMKLKTFNSAYQSISKFVKDDKLRKALAFQTLYIGISPYNGPSIYTIIPMIELLYGVWYMEGGMYTMTKGLEKLFKELGGTIQYNIEVDEILVKDKKAYGVRANAQTYESDHVVCNADFPYAMKHLIKEQSVKGKYTDKKIDNMEYSCSCFMMYLGLDKKYPDLSVHNIMFAKNFDKNIHDIFEAYKFPEDPSFYLYSPSRIDATVAPEGKENLYVLVPVPELSKKSIKWNDETIQRYREKLLNRISEIEGLEDIKENIVFEEIFTPNDFKDRFNAYNGATFGLKPTLLQSNYFRPHNKYDYCDNLYFTGSSVHPGAGVPIVLTSSKLVVEEIEKDNG
ncbi:phytoene desaturase [Natranaerovirga hydrolytica]|uniref:Phytoene desaturase n=1 Tax=Natranaerovirga hydrolytica TaxID=680378 RepID=A0A4R1N2Q2_9FIRM|nr:phytoene desaturase family protein [Natranaerovirga hydrolytica]TCK98284.1 phytoene desaturase [Natranaerovirga hydrolytica]